MHPSSSCVDAGAKRPRSEQKKPVAKKLVAKKPVKPVKTVKPARTAGHALQLQILDVNAQRFVDIKRDQGRSIRNENSVQRPSRILVGF